MLMLCTLLAFTMFTGAYDAAAFGFSQGTYRAFVIAFLGGLLVLLLVAAVPLKHVRLASDLLMLCGSVFPRNSAGDDLLASPESGADRIPASG